MLNLANIKNTIKTRAESIKSSKLKSSLVVLIVIIVICLCVYAAYQQTGGFSNFSSKSGSDAETGDRPVSSLAARINSIEMKQAQWLSKYAAEKNASINKSQPGPMFADNDGSY